MLHTYSTHTHGHPHPQQPGDWFIIEKQPLGSVATTAIRTETGTSSDNHEGQAYENSQPGYLHLSRTCGSISINKGLSNTTRSVFTLTGLTTQTLFLGKLPPAISFITFILTGIIKS